MIIVYISPDVVTFVLARLGLQLNDAATIRCARLNYLPREGSYKTHIVSKVWSITTQLDEGFDHISAIFVARVLEARQDVGECPALCDEEMKSVLFGLLQILSGPRTT